MKLHTLSRTLLALFAAVALATTGCYVDLDDDDDWFGDGPSVRGSGNTVTETRIAASFSKIKVEGAAVVYLRQGTEQTIEVEADDNIVPIITTRVRNDELNIGTSEDYRSANPVTIYITMPVIRALRIDGSGDIWGDTPIEGDQLVLDVQGSGDVDLELSYTRLRAEGSGAGDFQLRGEVKDQEVDLLGSGNYQARDLASLTCDIRIEGSGDATVAVEEYLNAEIRGSGNVRYFGSPRVDSSISGSGSVIATR